MTAPITSARVREAAERARKKYGDDGEVTFPQQDCDRIARALALLEAVERQQAMSDLPDRLEAGEATAIDEARGWRPIESAPMEQWLLTWGVDAGHTIQRIPNDLRSFWAEGVEATHWQSLPAPPKGDA